MIERNSTAMFEWTKCPESFARNEEVSVTAGVVLLLSIINIFYQLIVRHKN